MQKVDVLIIGSGPAGVSTAMHLLRLDPTWKERMLLIEKAAHPRPKLCGGAITRPGLDVLSSLGIGYPLPIPGAEVDDVRLVYGERSIHFCQQPVFVVYDRPQLDACLAREAQARGATINENEAALSLELSSDGIEVRTTRGSYRAGVVVGADGSNGLTRRLVNPKPARARVARLLEIVAPVGDKTPHFAGRYALFEFSPTVSKLQGYFWEFPSWVDSCPALNCGIYDARLAVHRARADLPRLFDNYLGKSAGLSPPAQIQGHPIHWFNPRSKFSAPRLLLVGDAAGADALFGEGIAPALGYGKVAAGAIQDAFLRRDFSFRSYRRRLFLSKVGRYLSMRWYVAWWTYHLSWSPLFMRAMWAFGGWAAGS
jgi:flavin-dependent dehydrogenase